MAPGPSPDSARVNGKASRFYHRLAYLVVCVLVLTLYLAGGLEFAERKIEDIKFGVLNRPATGNLVLVEIDARSLSELGVWPWPRRLYAKVVEALTAAGAGRIAFDVDFSAHSGSLDDDRFAAALAAADGRVILPVFRQRASSRVSDESIVDAMPAPLFTPHVAVAHLNVLPSDDGRVRHVDSTATVGGGTVASLAVLLAGQAHFDHPVFAIDYGIDPSTVPRLSFVDVIGGRFSPEDVAGKLIIIGSTAAELGDILAVPRFAALPGPLLHVLAYETVVQGRALQRLSEAPVAVLVVVVVLCLGWLFEKLSLWPAFAATVLAVAVVVTVPTLVQAAAPVQIDVVPLLLAVLLSYVAAMVNRIDQQSLRLVFQSIDIRRNDVMMRNLVEKSIVGVLVCDEQGRIESANAAAESMFGYSDADLAGTPIRRLFPDIEPDNAADVATRRLAEDGQREVWGLRADGSIFPAEITANAFTSEGRASIVAFVSDISLRREQEKELAYRADHDSLTRLPNRTKFARMLSAALSDAAASDTMVAVFLLDLDRFKEVNDTLGHAIGDRLLQHVADRLMHLMSAGALLSRFGGDEFAVFLPHVRAAEYAEAFAAHIVDALKQPFDVEQVKLEIGGSIGYALFPKDGTTTDSLLKRADIAMYTAKRLQSGHARYWAEDDAHSLRNLTLTGDLRRAIEGNELALAFQPKVDLTTGEITGAEVLCRWDGPEHGEVSPEEFIGHAEQSGLIYPLTEWVLRKAVGKAAIWREFGWDLNIAINLSARLLHHERILSLVDETLKQWAFPPERLTLEITENALLVNPAHAMIVVSEFAALGVKVSIDDFGTGYSSLSYLTTLPASELKIDKSFVLGMPRDDSFKTVVKSVITMAHELDLRVVAEGIETEEAVATLRGFGCDVGQGFLFGKPVPAASFEALLNSKSCDRSPGTAARRA